MCKDCENCSDLGFDHVGMLYHIRMDLTDISLTFYENNTAL